MTLAAHRPARPRIPNLAVKRGPAPPLLPFPVAAWDDAADDGIVPVVEEPGLFEVREEAAGTVVVEEAAIPAASR
jgi:hypothetical protein